MISNQLLSGDKIQIIESEHEGLKGLVFKEGKILQIAMEDGRFLQISDMENTRTRITNDPVLPIFEFVLHTVFPGQELTKKDQLFLRNLVCKIARMEGISFARVARFFDYGETGIRANLKRFENRPDEMAKFNETLKMWISK